MYIKYIANRLQKLRFVSRQGLYILCRDKFALYTCTCVTLGGLGDLEVSKFQIRVSIEGYIRLSGIRKKIPRSDTTSIT
jgi:hypothetical protein